MTDNMVDTTIIDELKTMIKPSNMTPEQKKERKRVLQREYMAKRRAEDPEFAQKQRDLCNARKQILRENTEYVQKERAYCKNYYSNIRREYLEMKDILKSQKIG